VPTKSLPPDPSKTLAGLPKSVQSLYLGFATPVQTSSWANWEPKLSGKATIGLSFMNLVSPFQATIYESMLSELKSNPAVGNVVSYTAASPTDIAGQLQQFQSLIQQHVDMIVLLAPVVSPFVPLVEQAEKAGIPTVSLVGAVDSPGVVSVAANTWQGLAEPGASILKAIGQKGNVLLVHGVPGSEIDSEEFAGFDDLLAACPDVKVAGEVNGEYNPPVIKSSVLQFLSTHTEPIDAVFQSGTMATSIMQAFEQAGKTVPPVIDVAAQKGSLAYWNENSEAGYSGGGSVAGAVAVANQGNRIVSRMLAGQGPKVNAIIWPNPVVSADNLESFVEPGWTLATPGAAENPPSTYITEQQLDALFNHPDRKVPGS